MSDQSLLEMAHFLAKGLSVVGAFAAMIFGMWLIFRNLGSRNRVLGPHSVRAVGVVIFIPTLLVLALLTDFGGSTLAALLGTVAGYVLSDGSEDRIGKVLGAKKDADKDDGVAG